MPPKTALRDEVVTIGGERYVVRADNVLVPAAAYFDPETVTIEERSVVTYDDQARVVEQVASDGISWRGVQTGPPRRSSRSARR